MRPTIVHPGKVLAFVAGTIQFLTLLVGSTAKYSHIPGRSKHCAAQFSTPTLAVNCHVFCRQFLLVPRDVHVAEGAVVVVVVVIGGV